MHGNASAAYRRSIMVALALAIFTVVEYFAAIFSPTGVIIMFLIALVKSYFVVNNYMHINRLWSAEDGGH